MQMEANLSKLRAALQGHVSRRSARSSSVEQRKEDAREGPRRRRGNGQGACGCRRRRMDPMSEREARQLDAAIERIEAQLKAKDAEAKDLSGEIANAEKGIRKHPEPDRIHPGKRTAIRRHHSRSRSREAEVRRSEQEAIAIADRGRSGAPAAGRNSRGSRSGIAATRLRPSQSAR